MSADPAPTSHKLPLPGRMPEVSLVPVSTRATTFADVAMVIARDMPHYLAIVVLAILALHGSANVQEFLIGTLATLGFKSWPRPVGPVASALLGGALIVLLAGALTGCPAGSPLIPTSVCVQWMQADGGLTDAPIGE